MSGSSTQRSKYTAAGHWCRLSNLLAGPKVRVFSVGGSTHAILTEEQFFLQRVIMHSSLIFIPRASSPNDLLRHLELCAQVMTVYINIARQLDRRVSLETWEVFLKVRAPLVLVVDEG